MNTPYTPQYNGVVERMNRILMAKIINMFIDLRLRHKLQVNIVGTSSFLTNISPSSMQLIKFECGMD